MSGVARRHMVRVVVRHWLRRVSGFMEFKARGYHARGLPAIFVGSHLRRPHHLTRGFHFQGRVNVRPRRAMVRPFVHHFFLQRTYAKGEQLRRSEMDRDATILYHATSVALRVKGGGTTIVREGVNRLRVTTRVTNHPSVFHNYPRVLVNGSNTPLYRFRANPFHVGAFHVQPTSHNRGGNVTIRHVFLSILYVGHHPFFSFLRANSHGSKRTVEFRCVFGHFHRVPIFFQRGCEAILRSHRFTSRANVRKDGFRSCVSTTSGHRPTKRYFVLRRNFEHRRRAIVFRAKCDEGCQAPTNVSGRFKYKGHLRHAIHTFCPSHFSIGREDHTISSLRANVGGLVVVNRARYYYRFLFLLRHRVVVLALRFGVVNEHPLHLRRRALKKGTTRVSTYATMRANVLFGRHCFFALLYRFHHRHLSHLTRASSGHVGFLVRVCSFLSCLFGCLGGASSPSQSLVCCSLFCPVLRVVEEVRQGRAHEYMRGRSSLLSSHDVFRPCQTSWRDNNASSVVAFYLVEAMLVWIQGSS